MRAGAACCALLALCAAGAGREAGGPELALLAPAAYELETTLQLNDAARADREVGYKLRATLHVAAPWAQPPDYLLEFRLESPKLHLRGKHVNADFMPYESVWDSYSDTTFYAHWTDGLIKTVYLDPDELPDVLNYKKALLSLFQVQHLDGEYNETDVSGSCDVLYETISPQVFRKIKRSCAGDSAAGVSSGRRVARYSLRAGALQALHAEELLALGPAALGVKARSWHRLERRGPGAPAGAARSLAEALRALPAALQQLRDAPLSLQPADVADADDEEELGAAGAAALAGEAPGAGGGAEPALAALRLLPPARRANHSALLQLLQREDVHDHLPGLCRLLGLAGTRAAHSAAADFLQLSARDPLAALADTYLAAFALAPAPDDWAVQEVLRLGEEARSPPVRDAALLAGAAAARSGPSAGPARAALARGLARCRDPACRALRLHALGNLRRADTADLLLEHAERADAAAPAALAALAQLPPAALTFARLDRLSKLALRLGASLELRAAALELLVERRARVPTPLAQVAWALYAERGADAHELRRVLWGGLARLAARRREELAELRALPARLAPELRGWDARAPGGTSSVLAREPGWAAAGWRAELQSVQVARAGLLRRGVVRLLAADDHDETFDALTVDVWTRGLEAFSGANDGAGDEQPAEDAAGGLALSVGGARMRDIPLFHGQAELLGHVWAGTASSPTPVLRALLPLHERAAALPLLGGALAGARAGAALALALDAQAQASLWWRSARAELRLRAGLAAAAALRVRTRWAALGARAELRAEPRLRLAADLDFYSGVALCVRAASPPHELRRDVRLRQRAGRLRVRRARAERRPRPGRTLALGRRNDVTCRTLREPDPQPEPGPDSPDADVA